MSISTGIPLSFRQRRILEIVGREGFAAVQSLASTLQCSTSSIRRDLRALHHAGLIQRIAGGAKATADLDLVASNRPPAFLAEKNRIGQAAAELVSDHEVIAINAGTTALALAKCLLDKRGLVVVTVDLEIADLLSRKADFEVVALGGQLQRGRAVVVGNYAVEVIRSFVFDKAFLGVRALNVEDGLMTDMLEQAAISRSMIEAARDTIVIADSSKALKRTGVQIAPFSAVDVLVTDAGVNDMPALVQKLRSSGVRLITV